MELLWGKICHIQVIDASVSSVSFATLTFDIGNVFDHSDGPMSPLQGISSEILVPVGQSQLIIEN